MNTVCYASFCCPKDIGRAEAMAVDHVDSHAYAFDEKIMVYQRCQPNSAPQGFQTIHIADEDYPRILGDFGIKWPDPILDELTHGWSASHFWGHHVVNHLRALQSATSDYIVFADADCYMKNQPEGKSWITRGIKILEDNSSVFVVSPNDGGTERPEVIMSQQMFLIRRLDLINMEFIPWDGHFIEGGPFQEYYGLLEGKIARFMEKKKLCRYVLGPEYRYHHAQWH